MGEEHWIISYLRWLAPCKSTAKSVLLAHRAPRSISRRPKLITPTEIEKVSVWTQTREWSKWSSLEDNAIRWLTRPTPTTVREDQRKPRNKGSRHGASLQMLLSRVCCRPRSSYHKNHFHVRRSCVFIFWSKLAAQLLSSELGLGKLYLFIYFPFICFILIYWPQGTNLSHSFSGLAEVLDWK